MSEPNGNSFVARDSIATIDRGGADDTARFLLNLWRSENGHMPDNKVLHKLSPFLIVFDDQVYPGDTPEILFHGANTLFAEHFPEAAEDHCESVKALISARFREEVCAGYLDASRGEPVFETIGTGKLLGPQKPEVVYDRLVLRFKKKVGSYLVSYSIKRSVVWLSEKADLEDRLGYSPQKSDPHLRSPGGWPSGSHMGALGETHILGTAGLRRARAASSHTGM